LVRTEDYIRGHDLKSTALGQALALDQSGKAWNWQMLWLICSLRHWQRKDFI